MKRSLVHLILLVVLPLSASAQTGWYPIHPPMGRTDLDVATDSILGFFGNDSTCISFDCGNSWVANNTIPGLNNLGGLFGYSSIKIVPPSTVILLGNSSTGVTNGQIYPTNGIEATSKDSGRTWSAKQVASSSNYATLNIIGHTKARWVYGFQPYDYSLVGYAWIADGSSGKGPYADPRGLNTVRNLQFSDSNVGMQINNSYHQTVLVSKNGGVNWDTSHVLLTGTDPMPIVHPGARTNWYISNNQDLLCSPDTGATWSKIAHFASPIQEFQFFDSVGYVVFFNQDYIMKTTDAGRTWIAQSCSNGTNNVSNLVVTSKTVAYAWDNSSSDIMRTQDGKTIAAPVMSFQRVVPFGVVPHDSVLTATIYAYNVGVDTLVVTGYISDSANVSLSPSSFNIPVGDSLPIQIHYSTHSAAMESIRVRFLTNTVPAYELFHVTGVARSPLLTYSSKTIDFGTVLVGERQTKKLRISNSGQDAAGFVSAKTNSTIFSAQLPPPLPTSSSEVLSVSFAPDLAQSYNGTLIVTSNAFTPDTILLHGTGITSMSGNVLENWHKSFQTNDSISGIATNILSIRSNKFFVTGEVQNGQKSNAFVCVSFDPSGSKLFSSLINNGPNAGSNTTCLIPDYSGGYYVAYPYAEGIEALLISHLDSLGSPNWTDTVTGPGTGYSQNYPVVIAANNNDDCALMCSGFAYAPATYIREPGQILLKTFDQSGQIADSVLVNGSAAYLSENSGTEYGLDYGTDLKPIGNRFVTALSLDMGQGDQYSYPSGFPYDYTAEVVKFGEFRYWDAYEEHSNFGSGKLLVADSMIYEVGRAKDSSWYMLAMDTSDVVHYRVTIPKTIPLDQLYAFSVNPDTSAILTGFKTNTLSGRDVSILKVSASGSVLWQDMFDGLGSGDDNPVKMIVKDGFEYVLVQSMDTAGNDWVLLKYDSVGNQICRLRYAGPAAGENTARDFTILNNGTIYVVGGAAIDSGVQQFTVVKYGDTTADTVPQQPIAPLTLNAHLTNNPWSTTTTLAIDKAPNAEVTIHIYDILGNERFATTTTAANVSLSSQTFHPGFYTIQLTDASGAHKVVKFVML
jgi:hypothetical protein